MNNNFISFIKKHWFWYPSPMNLNIFWNWGFFASMFWMLQLISGLFLATYYSDHMLYAFYSVEYIMSEVYYGWFFSYLHSNGASFLFIILYVHMGKGMYYNSYKHPSYLLWNSGILIFLLSMGMAFLGYVLPWGQMSFWGATVITNFISSIPYIGNTLLLWMWGDFSMSQPTLGRLFMLHFLLPFLTTILIIMHLNLLHLMGSSNNFDQEKEATTLYPYFWLKDLFGLLMMMYIYLIFVFFYPNYLGHSDNYMKANPMSTPEHIVPEWYFLPFYAMLRAIPSKGGGMIVMLCSMLFWIFLSWLLIYRMYKSFFEKYCFSWVNKSFIWMFFICMFILGWLGQQPAQIPFIDMGVFYTFLYILYSLIYFPMLN